MLERSYPFRRASVRTYLPGPPAARAGAPALLHPRMPRPVLLASDVHLGASPPHQERAFLGWLHGVRERASALVLNGDVFDFWFEYVWGHTRGHGEVLSVLRDTVDAGVPVTLMGGNHDWWGGRFLREEIGLEVLRDPVVRTLAGRRTLIAHGDGLGRGDLSYRVLRVVLRGRITRLAFGILPPAVGDAVAARVSSTRGRWEVESPVARTRSRELEAWASEALRADPELELVVLGHTHIPLLREVSPGRWYVNAGDWVRHRSYLVLEEGAPPRLEEWEGNAPDR